jgi:hypothetical protein
MMNKIPLLALFLFITTAAAAQTDTLLSKMPMVNGRLVYADSIQIKGKDKSILDTTVNKWFTNYFKMHRPDTLSKDKDVNSIILEQCALEFRMTTSSMALVKYDFYLIMTLKVDCYKGSYTYKIFDIFFVPKSRAFRSVGYYQTSPEYLIGLLNKKHMGLAPSINMGRKKIREYLTNTNDAILACITSFNKAMVN